MSTPDYILTQGGERIADGAGGFLVTGNLVPSLSTWTVDGKIMPRNPTSYELRWDKANVSYEPQADGSQIRVAAPILISGADLVLTWEKADRRLMNFILQFFNTRLPSNDTHDIFIGGVLPLQRVPAFFDTPQRTMSKDILSTKIGEGGILHDFQITLRTKTAHYLSKFKVPSLQSGLTVSGISRMFGSATKTLYDNVPIWGAVNYWNFAVGNGTINKNVETLGTAPWSPVIRFVGPFSAMTLNFQVDVDGTGQGVSFIWTGGVIGAGQAILFHMLTRRCYVINLGSVIQTEVYTFKFVTVSDGQPFAFCPPIIPGSPTPVSATAAGTAATTAVDFSNANNNSFTYW